MASRPYIIVARPNARFAQRHTHTWYALHHESHLVSAIWEVHAIADPTQQMVC